MNNTPSRPTGKRRLFLLVLLLPCVLSAALNGCGKPQQKNNKTRPPVPVDVGDVIQRDTPLFLEGIGNVMALNTVDVRSRVTGEVTKKFINEGDRLKKGQQMFVIDPAPFQAKVKEAEARVKQSKVLYAQAKRDFLRFQALYGEKAISQEQFESKEVDMNSKLYQVELNQAELESAQLNLGYCFIQSPLDGESGEIYINNFNIVKANEDKLVTIKQVQPIKVRFSVPGKFLDRIREHGNGDPMEVEAFVVGSDEPEKGGLTLIDNSINLKTGMIMLEGTFPNPASRLWPGQFVRVRLRLAVTKSAVLVPQRAVNDGPQGQYVWLVNPEGTVAIRPVKVDRRSRDLEVVSKGLKGGDKVVTAGWLMLYPGAKIVTRQQIEQMRKSAGPTKPGSQGEKTKNPKGAGKS